MIYLKIKLPIKVSEKENYIKKSIAFLIGLVIPKANPQFENKMGSVVYWVLEFEDKATTPVREIGLGSNEETIMKMPYLDKYGYWIDNNLTYVDFINTFEAVEVTKNYFEEKWKELIE